MAKLSYHRINGFSFSQFILEKSYNENNQEFWEKIGRLVPHDLMDKSVIHQSKFQDIEKLAKWFQNSLEHHIRKNYAANYTRISAIEIMNSVYVAKKYINIIDPFCGSGRLLMGFLRSFPKNKSYPNITINELMLLPCLLSYYDLICYYQENNEDINKISVKLGDAFENLNSDFNNKFDLVIMNPPFTRIHRINPETRKNIDYLNSLYPDLIIGQPGLHYFALLLSNNLLNSNGKVVSILPGATFLSVYSKPLLDFYLNNYEIEHLIKLDNSFAFSDGSDLKEIVFSANKTQSHSDHKIKFSIASSSSKKVRILESISIFPKDLFNDWNWLKYFENPKLLTLERNFLSKNLIFSGSALKLNIIRGVEMYGPNFFCIPNNNWKIKSKTDNIVTLQSLTGNTNITMPLGYLVKALRKSGYYNATISPNFDDFILSIPLGKGTEKSIKLYSEKNIENSYIAQKKFGQKWIHHINNQISVKAPYGYLFLIDKLSIETSGVVCHYFDNLYSATKNFYIIKGDRYELKLQAAWINSSCFLVLYLINRREIGGKFGRMQIIDFLNTPLFVDFSNVSQSKKDKIINKFDKLRFQNLPSIPNQIGTIYRKELDLSILDALGIDSFEYILDEIYRSLKQKLC